MKFIDFLKIILRGVGQVFLQNNPISGILFLLGIFYNSWLMGIGAITGVLASTAVAFVLKYERKDIASGLYGFNGALIGVAINFLFKASVLSFVLIVFGALLSSVIMKFMRSHGLSPYTFPFVLATWVLIISARLFNLIIPRIQEMVEDRSLNILSSLGMGFAQVMFQASIITGAIFLLGILVNSRTAAIYAFGGALIGLLAAFIFAFPLNLINTGIFGFNAVLCGIAFAGKNKSSAIYACIAVILSVFIVYSMNALHIIFLTAPFVFATWITLVLKKMLVQESRPLLM